MIVKLQSGSFEPVEAAVQVVDCPAYFDKRTLIVYVGTFDSMDGEVDVRPEHIDRLESVHNSFLAKVARLATGEIPLKFCPPVQVDHSVSGWDTVGRLYGNVEKGVHTREDGIIVPALYGTVRTLGKKNVERVMDGRWTNVSIGADLETGKIQELTITPFPAAPDAAMLSRGQNGKPSKGEPTMLARLKSFLMRTMKLSAEDAEKKLAEMPETDKSKLAADEKAEHEKLKKYLTSHKKLSDEDTEKQLSEMDVEKKKELSAEVDEHEKKLAAEETEKLKAADVAKMSAARLSAAKLSTDFRASVDSARLSQRKTTILTRLSRLKSEAKITPAEIKKLDLAQLAGSNDATIEAVLKTYTDREPVILTGMMGSRAGADTSKIYKQNRMSTLEAETRANMPFLAATMKNRLAAEGKPKEEVEKMGAKDEPVQHMSAEEQEASHKLAAEHMAKIHAAVDSGKGEEAKAHLKNLMDHCLKHMTLPAHMSEGGEAQQAEVEMSALAENVKTMQTKFEEAMTLVGSLVGSGS